MQHSSEVTFSTQCASRVRKTRSLTVLYTFLRYQCVQDSMDSMYVAFEKHGMFCLAQPMLLAIPANTETCCRIRCLCSVRVRDQVEQPCHNRMVTCRRFQCGKYSNPNGSPLTRTVTNLYRRRTSAQWFISSSLHIRVTPISCIKFVFAERSSNPVNISFSSTCNLVALLLTTVDTLNKSKNVYPFTVNTCEYFIFVRWQNSNKSKVSMCRWYLPQAERLQ